MKALEHRFFNGRTLVDSSHMNQIETKGEVTYFEFAFPFEKISSQMPTFLFCKF